MAKYKAYSEYKDSGVEWLQTLPARWSTVPLKFLCTCNDQVISDSTDKDYEIEYVDIGSVSSSLGITTTENMSFSKAPSRARRLVKDGDIIISTVRTYLEAIAPIIKPPANMVVSTGFAVIRPSSNLDNRFASYCLRASGFIKEVVSRSVGISYPAINSSDLVNIPIPNCTLHEQLNIATFLDHETAKIDNLIEKQQQLIELLNEKRHAVISHVVTKGLNPDVPMKDSGVEWLGEVPEHWSYTRIKYVSLLNPSKSKLTYDNINECTFLPMEKLKNNSVITDENRLIKDVINGYTYFKDGDLLVAKVTPCFENKNIAIAKNLTNAIGFGSSEIYVIRTNKYIDVDYLLYRLQENNFMCAATGAMIGAGGLKRIPSDFLLNYQIVIPPKNEMKQISEYLINQENQYNALENQAIIGIQLLQERRTALISAAVTGKIDVRNWVAPGEQAKAESPAEAFA
ncbi:MULTISPECIES: restriction endonuclease subunit S [Citrobacter]|jgi:type I restriction enzyme S subunit|uniref:restriction endonuclease subunit S n=1 Tax=Citrobacter TaxID=544 RepID=UPI002181FFAA|nr:MULTISPECIES: restriction endonuclease subunit S [Citrobacter]ELN2654779.1 restriction endonuclease subunit S [Citrobacter braakii]MCS8551911.1 restriction endonuclease subunit S [Citrobacter sp. XY323]WFW82071.1 restriction endonuclease subunit S [Citrobacter braakii]